MASIICVPCEEDNSIRLTRQVMTALKSKYGRIDVSESFDRIHVTAQNRTFTVKIADIAQAVCEMELKESGHEQGSK
jgi:hypothetical protein